MVRSFVDEDYYSNPTRRSYYIRSVCMYVCSKCKQAAVSLYGPVNSPAVGNTYYAEDDFTCYSFAAMAPSSSSAGCDVI